MTTNNTLARLAAQKANQRTTSKSQIETQAIYLGAQTREHFATIKDKFGRTLKDDKGQALKSEVSDGDIYTLSEIGTSKIVKIVYSKGLSLEVGGLYQIAGLGYDMRQANQLLIDEDVEIIALEQEVE